MRRHQRYDAEQVQRDLGRIGDGEPLYGTVFNFKMFDYQLDFAGIEGITTIWPPGRCAIWRLRCLSTNTIS